MHTDDYLAALMKLPGMWLSQVSHDGRWVAWCWFRVGPAVDVYVAPLDASAPPLRLTATTENTYLVSWTPDSRAVIVEQDEGGDERVQLFRVDLDNPEVLQSLTDARPDYFIRGGQLHPDGRWLVYSANFDAASGTQIDPSWVYRHDLESGDRMVLARPEKPTYCVPMLSPRGTHVLYNRADLHPAGEQIWLVDIEGREDVEILNVGAERKVSASWFPDGERVVVLAETEAATHRKLGVWDLAGRRVRWLVDDAARNIEDAYVPPGSAHIVVIEVAEARYRCSLLDPQSGVETRFPELPGNLLPLAPAGEGAWLARHYGSCQPSDLMRVAMAAGPARVLSSVSRVWERTSLTAADFAPAEDFRWTSVDGLSIQGWLYRAAGVPRGTVVCVHGGPTYHSRDAIDPEIQFYVRLGFNVLDPNFRGSTGFGLDFQEAIKACGWGGLEQDDIRTGIEALIAAGIAEAGKVGITGTSYGGYSAWHAITHFPPELVAAAAPVCGMTDLVVDYENMRPDLRHLSEAMMGGSPAEVPERYAERSPIHFVGAIRGKLLIVLGAQDPNVSPENVRVVEVALQAAGVPYDVLSFADEGHGISRPKNLKMQFVRLGDFFAGAFGA